MFSVGVSDHVMIAHSFPDPFFGPAQRLHGATYAIDAEVETHGLNEHHVVMDIGAMKTILRAALAELDYQNLDELSIFKGKLSTTERVAEHIGERLRVAIRALKASEGPLLPARVRILVKESPNAFASYSCAIEQ